MNKKIIRKGLTCIAALLVLSAFLTACPEPGSTPGNEIGGPVVLGNNPLFQGSFEEFGGGVGVIQIFNENQVQGSLSMRSARNRGAFDTKIVAAIEIDESGDVLLLEGPYDPFSGMFNLSARTDDYIIMFTGVMDDSKEFFSPVITILRPDSTGNWEGGRAIIEPDSMAEFTTKEAVTMEVRNMPALIMGRHEQYNEWDDPADGPAYVYLISPAGIILLQREDDGTYIERDDGCLPFVEVDQISSREIHAIISNNHFDIDHSVYGFVNYMKDVTGIDVETDKISMTKEDWALISRAKYELWLIDKGHDPVRKYNKMGITISQGMLEGELLWGFSEGVAGGAQDVATVAEARALKVKTGSLLWTPQNLTVNKTENNIKLSWDPVEHAFSYRVTFDYYDDEGYLVNTPEFDLSAYFPKQDGGEWDGYHVYVRAIAAPGQVDWCNSWTADITLRYDGSLYIEGSGPLWAPGNLTVHGMNVSWDNWYPNQADSYKLRISIMKGAIEEVIIKNAKTYTLPQKYVGKAGFVQIKAFADPAWPVGLNVDSEYTDWVSFGAEVKVPILDVLKALPPQDIDNPFDFDNADLSVVTTWGALAELLGYSDYMSFPGDLGYYALAEYDGQVPNGFEEGQKSGVLELENGDTVGLNWFELSEATPFSTNQRIVISWSLWDYNPD